jgi:hypothetical protein
MTVLAPIVVLHAVLCLGLANAGTPKAPSNDRPAAVHNFPWLDATYDLGDGLKTTFVAGEHAERDADGVCNVCLRIRALTFGDVDGDGRDDALLVVSGNVGGAGTSISGYVFSLERGEPVLRAALEGGDRGEGGIESMTFKNGVVVVRRFDLAATDASCCPSLVEIQNWRWSGRGLEKVGPSKRVRRPPTPWFSAGRAHSRFTP